MIIVIITLNPFNELSTQNNEQIREVRSAKMQ